MGADALHSPGDILGGEAPGEDHTLPWMPRHKIGREPPVGCLTASPISPGNGSIHQEIGGIKRRRRSQIRLRANPKGLDPMIKSFALHGTEGWHLIPVELDRVKARSTVKSFQQSLVGIDHHGNKGHISIVGL